MCGPCGGGASHSQFPGGGGSLTITIRSGYGAHLAHHKLLFSKQVCMWAVGGGGGGWRPQPPGCDGPDVILKYK